MNYKFTLTIALCLGALANTGFAQNQKLLAITHATYRSAGSYIEDSVHYFHSGTKGNNPGKYKIPEFEYMEDSMYVYEYDNTNNALKLVTKRVSTYQGSDFKESIQYELASNGGWDNEERVSIKYAGGKPDTVLYEDWRTQGGGSWRASSRIIYTWNGNNVASATRQVYVYSGGMSGTWSWRNSREYTYSYSAGMETLFLDRKWITSGGGSWRDSFKRETTIVTGKISEVKTSSSDGTTWSEETRATYEYDGQSRLIKILTDIYNGTGWEPNRIDTSMYVPGNNTNNRDSLMVLKYGFGNFLNDGLFDFKYIGDGTGRTTKKNSQGWDGSMWKLNDGQDSIVTWYYGWNVGVNDVAAENEKVSIYPSPASNTINIALDGIATDKQLHFAILDMQGKLMKNWLGTAQPVTTVSIDELPAGNYVLNINDGVQSISQRFVVSK